MANKKIVVIVKNNEHEILTNIDDTETIEIEVLNFDACFSLSERQELTKHVEKLRTEDSTLESE